MADRAREQDEIRTLVDTKVGSTKPLSPEDRVQRQILGPGQVLEGRYRYQLVRRLGAGGFGSVFEASCTNRDDSDPDCPPERVAIKIFHNPSSGDSTRMLKREINSLLALKHPRIPRVYDWGLSNDAAYMVLKFYPNGSLSDLRYYMPQMEAEIVWRLLTDVLSALNAAHHASILHLDIKPANILVDDNGGFVLTDFGISQGRLVSWHLVDPGLGTLGFQSPEQRTLSEELMDSRTDLWGLGATVWSLYTGIDLTRHREIYRGAYPEEKLALPAMSIYRADTPEDLEDIVMSLLATRPDDRPGGAAEVLARIKQLRGLSAVGTEGYPTMIGSASVSGELASLLDQMMDPLWISMCSTEGFEKHIVKFHDGDLIAREDEESYLTYVLLKGSLRIERKGVILGEETREGAFVGEIATLTGRRRTASVIANGDVYACVFNAAELEKLVTCCPAVGLRLIHSMADRLARERLGAEEESD